MPPAETLLWCLLSRRQCNGAKFRRQHGIGRFVLDFYCPEFRLAIELDGETHISEEAVGYDAVRQREIEALGIVFLRFENKEVYKNAVEVAQIIAFKIEELRAECSDSQKDVTVRPITTP